jgi:hypothetical protein
MPRMPDGGIGGSKCIDMLFWGSLDVPFSPDEVFAAMRRD